MANLDTELHLLLVEKDYFEKNPSAGKPSLAPDSPLYISLRFSGDIAALEKVGFTVGNTAGNVAYGVTNLAGLEALARHPQVEANEDLGWGAGKVDAKKPTDTTQTTTNNPRKENQYVT